ncbi:MAG: hypothetical protein ACM3RX_04505, partial [Methanococcaceae archaeon]
MIKLDLKKNKRTIYVVLLTIVFVIAAINLISIYNQYSWKLHTRIMAEAKLKGEVSKIQSAIVSIEQLPKNLAYVLEFSKPNKEHLN